MNILLSLLLFFSLIQTGHAIPIQTAPKKSTHKPRIAIMSFQNKGGVTAEEANILGQRIQAHLGKAGHYEVLERKQILTLLQEQGFQQTQYTQCRTEACSATLGKLLNVDYLVLGGVSHLGKTYVLDARMVNIRKGTIEKEVFQDCICSLENVLKKSTFKLVSQLLSLAPAPKKESPAIIFMHYLETKTLAGEGWGGYRNGPLSKSQFNHPSGLAFLPSGQLIVADHSNHVLRAINEGNVSTYSGGRWNPLAGEIFNAFADGPMNTARFHHPTALAVSSEGIVYVADTDNHRIRKVLPDGSVVTFVGTGVAGYTDGNAAVAQFKRPQGIVLDSDGYLYVADTDNHVIRKVSPHGKVSTLRIPKNLNYPTGLALGKVNGKKQLFIADTFNHSIKMLNLPQVFLSGRKTRAILKTLAGTGQAGFLDGDNEKSQWNEPRGLSFIQGSGLYVSDSKNHRIRHIHLGKGQVRTLVGTGEAGKLDGNSAVGQYNYPTAIVFDKKNNALLISDSQGHKVRKLVLTHINTAL